MTEEDTEISSAPNLSESVRENTYNYSKRSLMDLDLSRLGQTMGFVPMNLPGKLRYKKMRRWGSETQTYVKKKIKDKKEK